MDVSVVMPCRNEEKAIGECVVDAKKAIDGLGLAGEVIVVDNASTDASQLYATLAGARVLHEPKEGYGQACVKGINRAKGDFIVLMEGNKSYSPFEIGKFVRILQEGSDVVVGTRFKGKIEEGSMHPSRRLIGNPLLTGIFNLLFSTRFSDCYCNFRGLSREARDRLGLEAVGKEFAAEMLINAKKMGLNIAEVPINYHPKITEPDRDLFGEGISHIQFMFRERFK
ncbi:MAG: glycosyltransferase family 2 protein [Candidatus Diapherotrites archaeon]